MSPPHDISQKSGVIFNDEFFDQKGNLRDQKKLGITGADNMLKKPTYLKVELRYKRNINDASFFKKLIRY